MTTNRRIIRIKAFQALFQLDRNPDSTIEEAISFAISYPVIEKNQDEEYWEYNDHMDEDTANMKGLRVLLPESRSDDQVVEENYNFLKDLVFGVRENKIFIDRTITEQLEDWSLNRLDFPNLLILRIATYELYFHEETDPSIVINEAIELTKEFNNESASKFVNGVLQGILDAKEA